MDLHLELHELYECFLDPGIVATIETLFERYEYQTDYIQSLEPPGIVKLLTDTEHSEEAKQLRIKLYQDEKLEQEHLPAFINAVSGWLIKNLGHSDNYKLVNLNEIAATCSECSELVARGFFKPKLPPGEIFFRAEDCIYSNGGEPFDDSGQLYCQNCGSYNIPTAKNADMVFLRQAQTAESLESKVRRVIREVAGKAGVETSVVEERILEGLATRFRHLRTETKRKRKKSIVKTDYSAVYNIFDMIAHHQLDLEHIPVPIRYKSLLTEMLRDENASPFATKSTLAMFRSRVKEFGRLSDKFLEHALNLGDEAGERKSPHDRLGIRVVVPTTEICYALRGFVSDKWESHPERSDDFIAKPKKTGYQALHEDIHIGRLAVEVQIKTFKMDGDAYMQESQKQQTYTTDHRRLIEESQPGFRRVFHALCGLTAYRGYEHYWEELVGVLDEQSKLNRKQEVLITFALHTLIENLEEVLETKLDAETMNPSRRDYESILKERFSQLRISEEWPEQINRDGEERAAIYVPRRMGGKLENMYKKYRTTVQHGSVFCDHLNTYLIRLGLRSDEVERTLELLRERSAQVFTRTTAPGSKKTIYKYEVVP